MDLNELFNEALDLHRSGAYAAAIARYTRVLDDAPDHADSLHLRGTARYQSGDPERGVADIQRAIAIAGDKAAFYASLGAALAEAGRADDAIAAMQRARALDPARAADLDNNIANQLANLGRLDEAIETLKRAVAAAPDNAAFQYNLGILCGQAGRVAEAHAAYGAAIALKPNFASAHNNKGELHRVAGEVRPALDAFERALAADPRLPEAWNNLGICYRDLGWYVRAEDAFGRALEARSKYASCFTNIGNLHRECGRYAAALDCYRRTFALDPNQSVALSNVIFTLFYDPAVTGGQILAEARTWDVRFGRAFAPPVHRNARDPERRLRVGYLSADFRSHAAGYFLEPLIAHHDKSRIEVYGYSAVAREDDVSRRIRANCAQWRPILTMTDAALAEQVRADGVDILVDCGAHTGGNRLLAFARKPAPVQVSLGFLGHGGTTGLSAIDYFIGDESTCPPGYEAHYSEKLVRMPGFFAPFAPDPAWPDPFPAPPPEPFIFACVAEPARLGSEMLAVWRGILGQVPHARILLKNKAFNDDQTRGEWQRRLNTLLGDRVDVEGLPGGWSANMALYGRVSAVIDTFPASGATTVLIPLWMGVPVLTRAGVHTGQRFGAAIVAQAGHPELVAASTEEWVAKAVALTKDPQRLVAMRQTLRAQVRQSPLCDASLIARGYDDAYRTMWRTWCAAPVSAG